MAGLGDTRTTEPLTSQNSGDISHPESRIMHRTSPGYQRTRGATVKHAD
ncbi:unnamed protein product [Prunus brigantina]